MVGTGAPQICLRPEAAAAALGMSRNSFDRHVGPHVRWIRVGRMKIVRVAELEEWAKRNSEFTLSRGRDGR